MDDDVVVNTTGKEFRHEWIDIRGDRCRIWVAPGESLDRYDDPEAVRALRCALAAEEG
jgi:hypothetical protein